MLIVGGNPANAGAISADAELYDFDVLFRSPGSNEDLVGLNWQQGASAVHDVPTYTPGRNLDNHWVRHTKMLMITVLNSSLFSRQ